MPFYRCPEWPSNSSSMAIEETFSRLRIVNLAAPNWAVSHLILINTKEEFCEIIIGIRILLYSVGIIKEIYLSLK